MRSRTRFVRALVSAFVALVFTVAAIPGPMAMPAPQSAASHSMDCMAKAAPSCNHMKPVKEQGSPCKNMQVCMGMLGCFGMAAVTHESVLPFVPATNIRLPNPSPTLAGLTLPPDDRPPIA